MIILILGPYGSLFNGNKVGLSGKTLSQTYSEAVRLVCGSSAYKAHLKRHTNTRSVIRITEFLYGRVGDDIFTNARRFHRACCNSSTYLTSSLKWGCCDDSILSTSEIIKWKQSSLFAENFKKNPGLHIETPGSVEFLSMVNLSPCVKVILLTREPACLIHKMLKSHNLELPDITHSQADMLRRQRRDGMPFLLGALDRLSHTVRRGDMICFFGEPNGSNSILASSARAKFIPTNFTGENSCGIKSWGDLVGEDFIHC